MKLKYKLFFITLVIFNINVISQNGRFVFLNNFKSNYVSERNIVIYLPSTYQNNIKHQVLYMHDGNNLFFDSASFGGVSWGAQYALEMLLVQQKIKPTIIVAIFNTPKRFAEYMPEEPFHKLLQSLKDSLEAERGKPESDLYLKFITQELRPYINKNFKVLTTAKSTYIAGSSMGGLISWYALIKYPKIFGGAACLSTHWPVSLTFNSSDVTNNFLNYIKENSQTLAGKKLYFDTGNQTLDSWYAAPHKSLEILMNDNIFSETKTMIKYFPGAAHNEKYWRIRLHVPMEFLLNP